MNAEHLVPSSRASPVAWWNAFVDPRVGIIRRLEQHPTPRHFPRSFRLVTAVVADSSQWSPWHSDAAGAGYALADQPTPFASAAGEAIERYCGNIIGRTTHASAEQLASRGTRHVDPARLALFSPEQLARPGFPFAAFDPDLQAEWVEGTDLLDGRPTMAPASLVWASHPVAASRRGLPPTNPVYQPGLAAGADLDGAVGAALLELVERDAMVLAWCGGRSLTPVRPPAWLERLGRGPDAALDTRFVTLPNPFGLHVAGALIRDHVAGYVTMGLACRPTATDALVKALGEGLQLQLFVASLDDPDGPFMAQLGPASALKPWRADRQYLDSYAADQTDVTDDICHLQLHLDPRMQERFEAEFAEACDTPPLDLRHLRPTAICPAGWCPRQLAQRIADETGSRPVAVDVTTDDVAPSGPRVVRVVAAGLYANSSLAYPFEGGRRLAATIAETGRRRSTPLPH